MNTDRQTNKEQELEIKKRDEAQNKGSDKENENNSQEKVLIPISWKDELYMVKEKALEEIEAVFNDHMKTEIVSDDEEKEKLENIKHHFKKRLKGFFNNVICTFRDNVEYLNFDDLKKNKQSSLYTIQNEDLAHKNNQTLNQFREIINRTGALKEKVMYQFQEKIEHDMNILKTQILTKQKQQAQIISKQTNTNLDQLQAQNIEQQQQPNLKNIFKVKDDKGQEKDIDLSQYIKLCIDQYQPNFQKVVNKVKELQPELKEQLNSYHMNTRQQIKRTIEFQYALESIKNTKELNPFVLPTIPDNIFD